MLEVSAWGDIFCASLMGNIVHWTPARMTGPVKVIGLIRGAGAAEVLAALPVSPDCAAGVRGMVVSEVIDHLVPGLEADAFLEVWLDDAGGWAPPAGLDGTWWLTTEHVYKARAYGVPPTQGIKVIGTAYRRDDFDTRAFFDYWRDVHGPISGRAPGLGRVRRVRGRWSVSRGDVSADGFVEQWWPDRATLDRASASPEVAIAWEDVQKYAKTTGTFWVTREHVVQPPAPDDPERWSADDARTRAPDHDHAPLAASAAWWRWPAPWTSRCSS